MSGLQRRKAPTQSSAAAPAPAAARSGGSNQARQERRSPKAAFTLATSGRAGRLPFGRELEQKFGTDFSDVEAHVGTPEARAGLAQIHARAATIGRKVAFAEANPSKETVAHEAAHLSSAGAGDSATQLSSPGQSAEKDAEQAGKDVAAGRNVDLKTRAPGNTVHRSLWGTIGGAIGGAAVGLATGGPVGALVGGIGGALAGDRRTSQSRGLSAEESAAAQEIFGDSVAFGKVKIVKNSVIASGAPKTIGNHIYLQDPQFEGDSMRLTPHGQSVLVHELGHVWQFQNGGLGYIPSSLWSQFKAWRKTGSRNGAYDWKAAHNAGTPWQDWNAEQQAQAISDYNDTLRSVRAGNGTAAHYQWLDILKPYMEKVRRGEGA